MRIILSPVGTSLLTNLAGDNRSVLNQVSNLREEKVPAHIRDLISSISEKANNLLATGDMDQNRKASAELNGIFGIYQRLGQIDSRDIQFLIATDTYQGQVTAGILKGYLSSLFPNTQVFIPSGLSTENRFTFLEGIKELLNWCDENLPGFKKAGYEIIFNLTGGFKSLQGYLNTIGMFYADEIAYIFEGGEDLISIPKLPLNPDFTFINENASVLLRMNNAPDGFPENEIPAQIPETMLDIIGDMVLPSAWGKLIWNHSKRAVLRENLIPLPYLVYEDSFIKDFQKTNDDLLKVKLQESLGMVSVLLSQNHGDVSCLKGGRAGGLLYYNYSGKNSSLGHFRLSSGYRVSCMAKQGELCLRHFGSHDFVNDNP